jgi:hypothetical protein
MSYCFEGVAAGALGVLVNTAGVRFVIHAVHIVRALSEHTYRPQPNSRVVAKLRRVYIDTHGRGRLLLRSSRACTYARRILYL